MTQHGLKVHIKRAHDRKKTQGRGFFKLPKDDE